MAKRASKKAEQPGSPGIFLRIPDSLGIQLLGVAKAGKCTVQAVILSALAEHFAVKVDLPKRGGKKKLEKISE